MSSFLNISSRTLISLIILAIGLLGMALALLSGDIHRKHALHNHELSIQNMLQLKAGVILDGLAGEAAQLGIAQQHENKFRQYFDGRQLAQLQQELNIQFHRVYTTAGLIDLEKIAVYDREYNFLVESTEGVNFLLPEDVPCAGMFNAARQRSGPERIKVLSWLCSYGGRVYQSTVVPVGGLSPRGYLVIVTDPVTNLLKIGDSMGMPISIYSESGDLLHQSAGWSEVFSYKDYFISESPLLSNDNNTVLVIKTAENIEPLYEKLPQTRTLVMLGVGIATAIAVMIALWIMDKTIMRPLEQLNSGLSRIRRDRSSLSDKVDIDGTREIENLANNFNEMTAQLSHLYKRLESMAFTDQLTNLPNRYLFNDKLRMAFDPHKKQGGGFALFMMDMDKFKIINDTLGHQIGDKVLKEVGVRLMYSMRGTDRVMRVDDLVDDQLSQKLVARLGGDEFAAIITGVNDNQRATVVAEKIIRAMESPIIIDTHTLNIGISIGIALYPIDGEDEVELMRKADIALYAAKNQRRGYMFYDATKDREAEDGQNLESDLGAAVLSKQFDVYYQPKISLKNGEIIGGEALLRWNHPTFGTITADRFIHLAENTGVINSIAELVINMACEQQSKWVSMGRKLDISVNVSPSDVHSYSLVETIKRALAKWNTPPERIILEVAESSLTMDRVHVLSVIEEIRRMGIRISIDDFGLGHSSLLHLRELPIDEIKIDKTFVRDIVGNNANEAIVRSVMVLADRMGIDVVAEGVESEAVLGCLRELGADIAQGYYLGEPMPLEEFESWMKNQPMSLLRALF